jgi:drug/metabolite transporter superfamily protein YnfA
MSQTTRRQRRPGCRPFEAHRLALILYYYRPMNRSFIALLVMLVAATFEVAGDALIRKGLRGAGPVLVAVGFVVLGMYGIVVNKLDLDFSKLLGAYVGFFALVSVCTGRWVFRDAVSPTTWLGLGVILAGSLIIHVGSIAR